LDLVVFQVKMLKISSLSIGNQTFEIPCASAIECTLDGLQEDRDQCLPQIVKDYRVVAIVNIALVIIIGGLGNLLTIIAICSARIRHKKKFEHLWNSTTVLMLNLSLSDFLFCFFGLPVFIAIYYYGYLPQTDLFCWYSAMIWNWIATTEFLTMAAIAVNRLVGCLLFNYKMTYAANRLFDPKVTSYACVGIWILAFIILSPFTFSITIGSYQVGTFGYDAEFGKCDIIFCQYKNKFMPGTLIILFGMFVPFVTILLSYIIIGIILEFNRRNTKIIQSKIPFGQIQTNLLILTISRNLFFVPSVVLENVWIETNRELVHLCVSSWFWWIFAINFLFYVLTLEDFRKLYRQLFFDLNILKSFDVNSSPVNTSNISLNPTSRTLSNAS